MIYCGLSPVCIHGQNNDKEVCSVCTENKTTTAEIKRDFFLPAVDTSVDDDFINYEEVSFDDPEDVQSVLGAHYGGDASAFEPIKIIEHYDLGFNLGNVIKYVLRAGEKDGETREKDLKKALTYLHREIYGTWPK